MSQESKQDKIIQSRLKVKQRFQQKIDNTSSLSNPHPLGSGSLNRHGMPEVPIGQKVVEKWPVLDLGITPDVSKENWTLELFGAIHSPKTLTWSDFQELESVEDVSDFHCVTTWSKLNMRWRGVRFETLISCVELHEDTTHILCYGLDNYTTNLPLEEALKSDVLLVHTYEDQPLPKEHGGPVRMITPQLYAWKGTKWIHRIEFLSRNVLGFWEERGYSNTAYPWKNDRYS